MEREQIFRWLQERDFKSIINYLKTEQKVIHDDPIVQAAISHFFNELLEPSVQSSSTDNNTYTFTQLYMLQKGRLFNFTNDQLKIIVVQICKGTPDIKQAYHYALEFPELPECKTIIEAYEKNISKLIVHEQENKIKISQVVNTGANLAISIFKSKQERLFFAALRNCYPNHFIYPNVALATIISSTFIKEVLSAPELKFFYNTTVDFVIIDQFNDFKPLIAIELDSEWHRLNGENKDSIKNKIFQAAGIQLYRIEHTSKFKTIGEFEKAILSLAKVTINKN